MPPPQTLLSQRATHLGHLRQDPRNAKGTAPLVLAVGFPSSLKSHSRVENAAKGVGTAEAHGSRAVAGIPGWDQCPGALVGSLLSLPKKATKQTLLPGTGSTHILQDSVGAHSSVFIWGQEAGKQ